MGLLTVGHGTLPRDALAALLTDAGVELVVDVRRFPGSRRHPHVNRGELEEWPSAHGLAYRWEERLGGRRDGRTDSPHTAIRNDSFRAYADHMDADAWRSALTEVLDAAASRTVAVMCSESVWWRCHRRFIADAVVLLHADVPLRHLMHDGRQEPHRPTEGVRVDGDRLVYDRIGQPPLFDP